MNLGDRMKRAEMNEKKLELLARMERSLTNQTPSNTQIARIEDLRLEAKLMAHEIVRFTPVSREQSLALTHLEDAVMWAVKAIVLEEG